MNLISNNNYISTDALYSGSYISHHGIKGQKWGVRRFQNEDGSLTGAGRSRYLSGTGHRIAAKVYDVNERYYAKRGNKLMASTNRSAKERALAKAKRANPEYERRKASRNDPKNIAKRKERAKKIVKAGAIAAGVALASYGAVKLYQHSRDVKSAREFAEFTRKMEAGRKTFNALQAIAAENVRSGRALSQTVSVRLPTGDILSSTFDSRR